MARTQNSKSVQNQVGQQREMSAGDNELHFEVDAGLLFQLGEQLVARPSIALAELIKNSYDADATKVIVEFQKVSQRGGIIIVSDNGNGMTFEDIERGWMRIATTDKVNKKISSRFCRPLTGAKGIGRFASRRLSNSLKLKSVSKTEQGSKEEVQVDFDWRAFSPSKELTSIPVQYKRKGVPFETPTGVTLHLEDIRDIWSESDIHELQQDLLSLTPPFDENGVIAGPTKDGCETDIGFSLELVAEEFPNVGGQLNEKFLDSAWGKLNGWVDEAGMPHFALNIRGNDEEELFTPPLSEEALFRLITGARFTIYSFVYRSSYVTGFNVREASAYGREYGGVRLYLDGFRVFPYGEPSDDWLELDKIRASRNTRLPSLLQSEAREVKRPLLLVPGNNQLFGAVYISQTAHPELQLTINRERLIENEAFLQLKEFIQTGIFWLTIRYARQRAQSNQDSQDADSTTVIASLSRLEDVISGAAGVEDVLKGELLEIIRDAKKVAESREEAIISEMSMLRILASAGTMIITFGHQLKAMVDGLVTIHTDLTALREKLPPSLLPTFDELLEQLDDWRATVEDQARQIGLLVSVDARQRKRRLAIREVVDSVIKPLRNYTKHYNIEVVNAVPAHIRTPPMFEAELHAVLLNLFTNALKAVRAMPIRRIQVNASQTEERVMISMTDTGTGLDLAKSEEVFLPFYTTSQADPLLGVGTGLGLTVVRDILTVYGATARFIESDAPWKTTIAVSIPREV